MLYLGMVGMFILLALVIFGSLVGEHRTCSELQTLENAVCVDCEDA